MLAGLFQVLWEDLCAKKKGIWDLDGVGGFQPSQEEFGCPDAGDQN